MTVARICSTDTVTVFAHESVLDAAVLMRQDHVGTVVVVEQRTGIGRVPIGILTDRDIVVSIVADAPESLRGLTVGEVMTQPVVTCELTDSIRDAVKQMWSEGVRRLAVVDAEGALYGVVAVDDVLGEVADHISFVVDLFRRERVREKTRRGTGDTED